MRGLNKVMLIGNLGRDPEIRSTPSGTPVANASLATTWKSGEKESTEWHRIVAFGRAAEIMRDYCHKGDRLYIEGRLQAREWEDKSGNKRQTTEVVAGDLVLLGGGSGKRTERPAEKEPVQARDEEPYKQDSSMDPIPDDDDLPF
jgi:single-strand DNA-binding protein